MLCFSGMLPGLVVVCMRRTAWIALRRPLVALLLAATRSALVVESHGAAVCPAGSIGHSLFGLLLAAISVLD